MPGFYLGDKETGPRLEKGEIKNQIATIGQDISVPCFEQIQSGTIPSFYWLKSKNSPNISQLEQFIQDPKGTESKKDTLEVMETDHYRQVYKLSNHSTKGRHPLFGIELVLNNMKESDEGFYTCIVANQVGFDYVTMHLKV